MNRNILKQIILEQQEELKTKQRYIIRHKLKDIDHYKKNLHAIIITGIRRCGKSTLLTEIMQKLYHNDCYYFNFEDERLINFTIEDMNELYEVFIKLYGEKKTFLLDEIQNIDKWETFVRRMQRNRNKFYLTGSNASLLSRELGTKLTGRQISLELFPYSFLEYLDFHQISIKKNDLLKTNIRAKTRKYFNNYLLNGGMPEFVEYKEKEVLQNVYDDILYRDIVTRYDIKDVKSLREITLYLLSNITSFFSYNKLKNYFGLGSSNTVKSYIDYLENSYLFFQVNKFEYSLKKQIQAPKKIYVIDNGFVKYISFMFSKDRGKFLENFVFVELKRRRAEVFYYKTRNDYEIDFLVREGKNIKLMQVCCSLDNKLTRERELRSLEEAMDELGLKNGVIITEGQSSEIRINKKKIIIKNVMEWALGSN